MASLKLHTGAAMPQVGLGTWQSAPGAVKAAVIAAVEAGYRHIDCAAGYGNEHEVGAALEDVIARGIVTRADLFITSKLWVANCFTDLAGPSLDKTLADLKTPYVDLYLVHWPYWIKRGSPFPAAMEDRTGYSADDFLAVWRVLEAAVDAGKVRALGTSNMSAKKLATLKAGARVAPAVNQVEAHPFLAQNKLQEWCTRHGIVCTAYSPLGSPDRPVRLVAEGDPAPLHDETVLAIAKAHAVEPAQVLIRWQVQRGWVAIPKSVTPARIATNIAVSHFELTAAEMASLGSLDAGLRLIKGLPFLFREGMDWKELWDEDWYATEEFKQ